MRKLESFYWKILVTLFLFPILACAKGDSLPTLVPTAVVPTTTPMPTATFSVHQNIDSLVRKVLGSKLNTLDYEQYTEYRGESYPDGQVGYAIDLVVTFPEERTREEMLEIAYTVLREIHFNYSENLRFAWVVLRSHASDALCAFNVGIGYQAVEHYLPRNQPDDLEAWYAALDQSDYFGDLPGETDALLAYANDPRFVPGCDLEEWK
jgi:hypothetical protein